MPRPRSSKVDALLAQRSLSALYAAVGLSHDSTMSFGLRTRIIGVCVLVSVGAACAGCASEPTPTAVRAANDTRFGARGPSATGTNDGWTNGAAAKSGAKGPPNAVMLDYQTPESQAAVGAQQPQAEGERSAGPQGDPATGTLDETPRIRQTIVIGRNNNGPVWDGDSAGGGGEAGGNGGGGGGGGGGSAQPAYRSTPAYYPAYGPGYYPGGRGTVVTSITPRAVGVPHAVAPQGRGITASGGVTATGQSYTSPTVGRDWAAPRSYGPTPVRSRTQP